MEIISEPKLPTLPTEVIDVPALGGAVKVRGLLLADRLAYMAWRAKIAKPLDSETQDEAHERVGALAVPRLLSLCVLNAKDKPLMSETQWNEFGAVHPAPTFHLFNRAWVCSGYDEAEAAKN